MFQIDNYISALIASLRQCFGARLLYVGLQGSYLRGEATENSDIDIMVVLDELTVSDMDSYRTVISKLPEPEKSCGFICGRADLANWNPLEICHLLHSTKDRFGKLAELVPAFTEEDHRNFIKMSLNNLYHELCHRYIHSSREKNIERLPGTFKSVFFILQDLHYLRTGTFVPTKVQLQPQLSGRDYRVLACAQQLRSGGGYDFTACFDLLFAWCQETLQKL